MGRVAGPTRKVRDEGTVVVAEAQVTEHVTTGLGQRPLAEGVELTGFGGDDLL